MVLGRRHRLGWSVLATERLGLAGGQQASAGTTLLSKGDCVQVFASKFEPRYEG